MSAIWVLCTLSLVGVDVFSQEDRGKMAPMPTMSRFMYARDFSKYQAGQWVEYDMGVLKTKISCLKKVGATTWIQVGMEMSGIAYDHLLQVAPDGRVQKAWFSSKGYRTWVACKINESPKVNREGLKDCRACGKPVAAHMKPDIRQSDEELKIAGKVLRAKKFELTMYKCDGTKAGTGTYWYSPRVPELHQLFTPFLKSIGKEGLGSLAKFEMGASKVTCSGFGNDAKPKHTIPK